MLSQPILGRLVHWSETKGFGFAETRNVTTGELSRYFVHQRRVIKQFAEVIERGCVVWFTVDLDFRPARAGELPQALAVEIWNKPAPAPTSAAVSK